MLNVRIRDVATGTVPAHQKGVQKPWKITDTRRVLKRLGLTFPPENQEGFAEAITHQVNQLSPNLPRPGESLAMALDNPKTASLAFDRVYQFPVPGSDPYPGDLGFCCASWDDQSLACIWICLALGSHLKLIPPPSEKESIDEMMKTEKGLRALCRELGRTTGTEPTLIFPKTTTRDAEFARGAHAIITTALTNVALVKEEDLSWDQIIEFRRDADARLKYRRFVRWVSTELATKSPKEACDLIALRLDDYEWAIKKHGMKTALGTLSAMLEPKFLTASSAATAAAFIAGGPWAGVVATGIAVGKTLVTFGTAKIDAQDSIRGTNFELAYVHDVKGRFGGAV